MCNNCGLVQGPFYKVMKGIFVCKNTKEFPDRIHECVERRGKQEARDLLSGDQPVLDDSP